MKSRIVAAGALPGLIRLSEADVSVATAAPSAAASAPRSNAPPAGANANDDQGELAIAMRLSALGNDEEEDGTLAMFGALRRQRGA